MSILLSAIALLGLGAEPAHPATEVISNPRHVSIIQLVADPDRYHGETVFVEGFARVEFEGNMLCLSREDAEQWQTKNCVWLNLNYRERYGRKTHVETATMRYVSVVGRFDKTALGHMGCCSGELKEISRLTVRDDG